MIGAIRTAKYLAVIAGGYGHVTSPLCHGPELRMRYRPVSAGTQPSRAQRLGWAGGDPYPGEDLLERVAEYSRHSLAPA